MYISSPLFAGVFPSIGQCLQFGIGQMCYLSFPYTGPSTTISTYERCTTMLHISHGTHNTKNQHKTSVSDNAIEDNFCCDKKRLFNNTNYNNKTLIF
jgi:hypothetical protein